MTERRAAAAFEAQHAGHLHRRGGEEFERAASDEPGLDVVTCPCGARAVLPTVERELAPADAADAVSQAFRDHISRRFGARQ
jgi:hypothetical protein